MKLAMVFPGQGSQAVGMVRAYEGLADVEAVRSEAASVLGRDFVRLLDEGPAEALGLTVNTQPAMVTAGYAAYRAWMALGGPRPVVVAGHSLGGIHGTRGCRLHHFRRLPSSRATSRGGHAEGGAGRRGGHGRHPEPVR